MPAGTGGAATQLTDELTAGLTLDALRATSEYVAPPMDGDVVVQVDVELVHPVQAKEVGPPEHVAVSVRGVLTTGVAVLGAIVHATAVGVGDGAVAGVVCQLTDVVAGATAPLAEVTVTA